MVRRLGGVMLSVAVASQLGACGARSDLLGLEVEELSLECPTTLDDPRLVMLSPGEEFLLDAEQFVEGKPNFFKWSVLHDDCDGTATTSSYILEDRTAAVARFIPARPSNYRVRLEVAVDPTEVKSCEFQLPVQGRGLRVELCWTNDEEADLDLFLHSPHNQSPFVTPQTYTNDFGREETGYLPTEDTCNVLNCTPILRMDVPRVDFGYETSSAAECQEGPGAEAFAELGICPNPRLGVDSNTQGPSTVEVRGAAERLQVDHPGDGHTFRIMVRNFNDEPATPRLFVYCGGVRTVLEPPALPLNFIGNTGAYNYTPGVMWRAVDITTQTDADGNVSCDQTVLTHPSDPTIPYVTIDDASY